MIYDWQGRIIESIIEDKVLENPRSRREFLETYLEDIGDSIGFKETTIKVLEDIFDEFKHNGIFHHKLGWTDEAEFFNAFFIRPYGYVWNGENFVDDLDNLILSSENINKGREEEKIIKFVRGINLPKLVEGMMASFATKYKRLEKFNEFIAKEKIIVDYKLGEEKLRGIIRAEFGKNCWNNVFSNFDDCIFVTQKEKDLMFQKYWFASLLHMYHPHVDYLDLMIEDEEKGEKLKNKFPFPLNRVILMETDNEQYPLLVEGVVGSNFKDVNLQSKLYTGMEEWVDFILFNYFKKGFQQKNKRAELFYGLSHQEKRDKPTYQMLEHIKKKYGRMIISRKKDTALNIPWDIHNITEIIIAKDNQGEQFSEAFNFSKEKKGDKNKIGSFGLLEGIVYGLSVKEFNYSNSSRILGSLAKFVVASLLVSSGINYYQMKSEEKEWTKEYSFEKSVKKNVINRVIETLDPISTKHLFPDLELATKKVIILPMPEMLAQGELLPMTLEEAEKKTVTLLERICANGGVNKQKELFCQRLYVKFFEGDFEQRSTTEERDLESIKISYNNIKEIKGVTLVEPRSFGLHIPYILIANKFSRLALGIEVTTFENNQYLIQPDFVKKVDASIMRELLNNLTTWIYLRDHNQHNLIPMRDSPLKCNEKGTARDSYFQSKMRELAPQFFEYQFHLKYPNFENNVLSDKDNLIDIKPLCIGDNLHYEIIINKRICLAFANSYKLECGTYDKEPLFKILTYNLRKVDAIKPNRLYLQENKPSKYQYYYISYPEGKQLEELFKPFALESDYIER